MKIQELAAQTSKQFEFKTINDERSIWVQREPKTEWINDMVFEAHDTLMPDDWKYLFVVEALDSISEIDDDINDEDSIREEAEQRIDELTEIYNRTLLQWLSSNLNRLGYCDDAASEYGLSNTNIMAQITAGYNYEQKEVLNSVLKSLTERLEQLEQGTNELEETLASYLIDPNTTDEA